MLKVAMVKVYIRPVRSHHYFLAAEMIDGVSFEQGSVFSSSQKRESPVAFEWKDLFHEKKTEQTEPYFLEPSACKKMLLGRHDESFFGALAEEASLENTPGIIVTGWDLVTFLAKEPFNPLFQWEWDEQGEIGLAACQSIYEAICEKDWMPDFSASIEGNLRWKLPDRVMEEFSPSFWEQTLQDGQTVHSFISDLFHRALQSYFEKNRTRTDSFHKKINNLLSSPLPPSLLSAYFDEKKWKEWIGLREHSIPFTLGMRLQEPNELGNSWELSVFLRGKENPHLFVDKTNESQFPEEWLPYLDEIEKEEERWLRLFPWLKGKKGIANQLTEKEAWHFLTEASECLLALGVEILLPAWWNALKHTNIHVKAKIKGSGNSYRPSFVGLNTMLHYEWRISISGVELSEEDFAKLVEENRRLVSIQGQWIKLDPAFVKHIQELMTTAEKKGIHVRELIEQQLLGYGDNEQEGDHLSNQVEIKLNEHWEHVVSSLKDYKKIPIATVPKSFNGELRPYQKQGMSWLLFLRNYRFGACLADDMGLGKTVQLIAYLLAVKERGEARAGSPALIVCPTSVLGNWEKEMERFAPSLKVYVHYGSNRLKKDAFIKEMEKADVVLTTYALAHLDLDTLEQVVWSTIVIDEAQNIKNPETKQSRAVRRLKGDHHIALTGTPMENRLSELWSIFDFINHGYLGSLRQFQKRFILPIEKENDSSKMNELKKLIRPFLLRRTKKDEEVALNLPEKQEQKEYCPLTVEQASLYEQLVRDTLAQLEHLTGFERKGLVLKLLNRLKQLCDHPALYLKEQEPANLLERSFKLEKLVEIVDNVLTQKESCLIFTQYIHMGEMICHVLKEKFSINVPFLHGRVAKAKRDQMIASFQNGDFPLFLLSLHAGGTGLNLTAANHVIHYDRWWNPAVENQATDRAYRIGQTRFVHVHKFISTGTIEEKIDAMLEKKQWLNQQIIQSDEWITELSTEELREFISLSK